MQQKNLMQEIKELMNQNGYTLGLDYTVIWQLVGNKITITPHKGINSNLRNELITLIVTDKKTPSILPNPA